MAINPQNLAPRRNPSLVQRISSRVFKLDPAFGPQPGQQETTQTGISEPKAAIENQFFTFDYDVDRNAIYRDADEMDSSSDEAATALDVIADNATTSEDGVQMCFVVRSENQKVQAELDQIMATARLQEKIRGFARTLAKYGDLFAEPEINRDLEIVDVRALPPNTMNRNEDPYGNLRVGAPRLDKEGKVLNARGECAFEQMDPDTKDLVAVFWPWQIVHARLNHDGFKKYGRSLLRVARLTWRKLKAMEEALIIGRLTRDLLKLVFYVDTTGLSPKDRHRVMSEFKNSMTERQMTDSKRKSAYSVLTDFYLSDGYVRVGGQAMPMRTRVDVIDPKNDGIHDITDLNFFHRKFLMDLRVPPAHLGWEQESAAGVLKHQDVQYVRWLRSMQFSLGIALTQVFNLGLALKGIDPTKVEFEIVWPALRATDEAASAQTFLAYAQGDQLYMQEGVLPPSWVQQHRFNMDPEEMAAAKQELDALARTEQQMALQQTRAEAQARGGVTANGPQDRDGQRKGDEGRDSQGKRIAPTKSKQGVNNPTGTGRSNAAVRNEKSLGVCDRHTGLLLELMRKVEQTNLKLEAETSRVLALEGEPVVVLDTTSAGTVAPTPTDPPPAPDGKKRRRRRKKRTAELVERAQSSIRQEFDAFKVLNTRPEPQPVVPIVEAHVHIEDGAIRSEHTIGAPRVKVNLPEQKASRVKVNVPERSVDVKVQNDVKVPEQAAPVVTNEITVPAPAPIPAPVVNVDVKVPKQETPRVEVNVPAPKVDVKVTNEAPKTGDLEITRDGAGNITGYRRKPSDS